MKNCTNVRDNLQPHFTLTDSLVSLVSIYFSNAVLKSGYFLLICSLQLFITLPNMDQVSATSAAISALTNRTQKTMIGKHVKK